MIIYLATPTSALSYVDEAIVKDSYILETYHAIKSKKKISWIDPDKFILDSGAYTFMRQDKKQTSDIDWDKYVDDYAKFIRKFKIKLFFELDIDSIVGYENVKKLTADLNHKAGRKCIPVWHRSRGLEAWKQMIEDYDYISISASGNNFSSEWTRQEKGIERMYKLNEMARKKGVKVHALGYTKLEGLRKIPFYSVDSTAWVRGIFGTVFKYQDGNITKTRKPDGVRMNNKNLAENNFIQYKKLQNYALKRLTL